MLRTHLDDFRDGFRIQGPSVTAKSLGLQGPGTLAPPSISSCTHEGQVYRLPSSGAITSALTCVRVGTLSTSPVYKCTSHPVGLES